MRILNKLAKCKQWIIRIVMVRFYCYKWNEHPEMFECSNCGCKTITRYERYCNSCGVRLKWY